MPYKYRGIVLYCEKGEYLPHRIILVTTNYTYYVQTPTGQSNGHYTGTKTLPGHVNEAMVWRAKVFVRQGERVTAGWFDFEAK